jgi:hypothetical protein
LEKQILSASPRIFLEFNDLAGNVVAKLLIFGGAKNY